MKQSRLMSWIETIAGTAIGFAIALATQLVAELEKLHRQRDKPEPIAVPAFLTKQGAA